MSVKCRPDSSRFRKNYLMLTSNLIMTVRNRNISRRLHSIWCSNKPYLTQCGLWGATPDFCWALTFSCRLMSSTSPPPRLIHPPPPSLCLPIQSNPFTSGRVEEQLEAQSAESQTTVPSDWITHHCFGECGPVEYMLPSQGKGLYRFICDLLRQRDDPTLQ